MAYNKAVSKVKVLVFCGGSGAKALEEGFYRFFPQVSPQYAINMYDDGQSSGVCRQLLSILGPSDLRKIQLYQHFLRYGQDPLFDFLERRLTIESKTKEFIFSQLKTLSQNGFLTQMEANLLHEATRIFFQQLDQQSFKDFSLANILYSGLVVKNNLNYPTVEKLAASILKIPSKTVVINSYQSLFLKGVTRKGKVVGGEHRLDYGDKDDPWEEIMLIDKNGQEVLPPLSAELKKSIEEADTVVFSSGNYWTSLIPSLKTQKVKELLDASPAKKFLVMNNREGSDMKGLPSNEVQTIVYRYLPPETVTFFNTRADKKMTTINPYFPALSLPLSKGNFSFHDPQLLCQAIMGQSPKA